MPFLRIPGQVDPLALHRRNPERYPFVLESAAFEAERGRYDLAFAFPLGRVQWDRDGRVRAPDWDIDEPASAFVDALDQAWWRAARSVPADDAVEDVAAMAQLPFAGGWALFLSYEVAAAFEPRLQLPDAPQSLPVALALRCPAAVIVDRAEQLTWLVAEPGHEACLDEMRNDVQTCMAEPSPVPSPVAVLGVDEAPDGSFLEAVRRAKDYLAAGDVFQVNLSRRWDVRLAPETTPDMVFAALRQANPAPFAGLLALDDWAIASSSPERLVEVCGDRVQTRPIAGTRPRLPGDDDAARVRELVGHPKERAEHVMLIDLERNDLGRLCVPGSVEVDELMTVESYAHVHHIVSNVRGRLRDDVTPGAILRAVFPGGTITGCPKPRCMQIIAELEGEGRGAYTGAFGYLGHDGRMDLNILIRSLSLQAGRVSFRAGAGIVADSDPDAELAETRAKARGLLRAFGLDGQGSGRGRSGILSA